MAAEKSPTVGHPNSSDEPPVPGGDPDQPPPDLPQPAQGGDRPPNTTQKPGEYGHVGVDDRPPAKDRPKPRQIF